MDKQLLEKYFRGSCTTAEAEQVEAYLLQESTPELDAYLLETWRQADAGEQDAKPAAKEVPVTMRIYKHWYRMAAAIVVLVSIGAWLWQSRQGKPFAAQALQWDTIYNTGNNIRLVSMPDGSKVWLNAHAHIAYTRGYNDTTRELWLKGEAYFEVAGDEARPFRVHTDELVTTALGTAFSIATGNRADGSIAVSLLEGKVAVSTSRFAYVLAPGQMLLYRKGANTAPVAPFNAAEVLDWKNGKVVFEHTSLADAFARLQSRYGCTITLLDKALGAKKISGVFYTGETLDEILDKLGYVHRFTYTRTIDDNYMIKKN